MSFDTFFYLSKLGWALTRPGVVLFLLFVLGTACLWFGAWRWGRRLLSLVLAVSLVLAIVPLGPMLTIPLENRFNTPDPMPDRVDGIIALGGVANAKINTARGRMALGRAGERITELARLAEMHPNAKLLFTGGSGELLNQEIKEADTLGPIFDQLGLDRRRLVLENQSRNTVENATLSYAKVRPKPGEVWILITSAAHMPRAMGVFRQAGWSVVAHPVDYRYAGDEWKQPTFNLIAGLTRFNAGAREWLGLIAYRLAGHTATLFPAP